MVTIDENTFYLEKLLKNLTCWDDNEFPAAYKRQIHTKLSFEGYAGLGDKLNIDCHMVHAQNKDGTWFDSPIISHVVINFNAKGEDKDPYVRGFYEGMKLLASFIDCEVDDSFKTMTIYLNAGRKPTYGMKRFADLMRQILATPSDETIEVKGEQVVMTIYRQCFEHYRRGENNSTHGFGSTGDLDD